eukprot:gnl/MRDRNA2_/MRDRNA2_140061_c0_seq1.p1 gnl/MRDRNA2_/MRDRNA2_140061_c0~~gnl/MRDRNA2_/MRDRNA2_140061_c0_seq1.p1  ORF type:complete len:185 (+),score=24.13 gnl/MRDRNA2_/MRDRNA2_140061_c0_seq1:188-742(+)
MGWSDTYQQYKAELKELVGRPRQFATQVMNLMLVVFCALMLWKGLIGYTRTESPVVVVLSGSMEPGMNRGDILFLTMTEDPIIAGDPVVFMTQGRDIPIIHRAMNVHESVNGTLAVLTKGDNNQVDDRGLYAYRQRFIKRSEIMGRAVGIIPYAGMIAIWFNDYPWLKVILVGSLGVIFILGRE